MNCNSRLSQIGSGGALETVQLTAGGFQWSTKESNCWVSEILLLISGAACLADHL